MGTIDPVLSEVAAEVGYQEQRWGTDTDDTKNTPWMWASYIAQYSTRWMAGFFLPVPRSGTDAFRAAMVKVAAIAVSAIKSVDRQRAANGSTFFEAAE